MIDIHNRNRNEMKLISQRVKLTITEIQADDDTIVFDEC